MCGIAGIISIERLSAEDKAALPTMSDLLAHRGPDGVGSYFGEFAALGHRRLAIVDLAGGRQPLSNEDGSVHAVVNGEFYDYAPIREALLNRGHRFASRSDSECLVHLYEDHGPECTDSLHGMFAFALWDQRNKTALLARDRLGVKPLYWHFDGRRLIFGSELKAVLAAPGVSREIEPTALMDFFTLGFIPSPKTIFKNIYKLPPASLLTFRGGRVSISSYWELRFRGRQEGSQESIQGELWERICRATQCRLLTEVPIGAFLSGGIDSTAVTAAMAEVSSNPVTTLTCGFGESAFDERSYARVAADKLGTRHHETLVSPEVHGIAETLCSYFDEPFADASAIPTYFLSREARKNVTVALSGDGGDESLAGYRRYRFDCYEEIIRRNVPAGLRRGLFTRLSYVYPQRAWIPRSLRAGATLRNLAADSAMGHAMTVATLSTTNSKLLLGPDMVDAVRDYDPLEYLRDLYHRCDAPDHLSKCQYVDIRCGLADGILTKVDRASMAHGLEVRSPMLDYRFVEFAWSIPPKLRIRRTSGKYLLREIVASKIDPSLAYRAKAGFEVPLDEWLKGPLRETVEQMLDGWNSGFMASLNNDEARRVRDEHLTGRRRHGPTLWKLVMLNTWAQRFLGKSLKPAAINEIGVRTKKELATCTH